MPSPASLTGAVPAPLAVAAQPPRSSDEEFFPVVTNIGTTRARQDRRWLLQGRRQCGTGTEIAVGSAAASQQDRELISILEPFHFRLSPNPFGPPVTRSLAD
jgi:hypothetical protein